MLSSKKDEIESSPIHTSDIWKQGLAIGGRGLVGAPGDNLAKRMQLYHEPLEVKDIGKLLFQGGTGINRLTNAYKGAGIGLIYKGLQTASYDKFLDYQNELEQKYGKNRINSALFSIGFSGLQTAVLYPISTVRSRLQVNDPDLLKIAPKNTPDYLNKSRLYCAIKKGGFYDGVTVTMGRSALYFLASSTVYKPIKQQITENHILGNDPNKANEVQENLTRILSGSAGVTASILLDNVKTLKQVKPECANQSAVRLIGNSLKTHGLFRTIRPGAPYIMSEALGLIGFYAGKSLANKIEEANYKESEKAQLKK